MMSLFLDPCPSSSFQYERKTKNQVIPTLKNLMEFSLCVTCNEEIQQPDAQGLIESNNNNFSMIVKWFTDIYEHFRA